MTDTIFGKALTSPSTLVGVNGQFWQNQCHKSGLCDAVIEDPRKLIFFTSGTHTPPSHRLMADFIHLCLFWALVLDHAREKSGENEWKVPSNGIKRIYHSRFCFLWIRSWIRLGMEERRKKEQTKSWSCLPIENARVKWLCRILNFRVRSPYAQFRFRVCSTSRSTSKFAFMEFVVAYTLQSLIKIHSP